MKKFKKNHLLITMSLILAGILIPSLVNSIDAKASSSAESQAAMSLGGTVFLDQPAGKASEPNGILDAGDTDLPEDVIVTLYDNSTDEAVSSLTTRGSYEFTDVDPTREYYIMFEYDGISYRPVTYRTLRVMTATGDYRDTQYGERSYASESLNEREQFNYQYEEVSIDTEINRTMRAYAEMDFNGNISPYKASDSQKRLSLINFGLQKREQLDLTLINEISKVDVDIDGSIQTFEYNSRTNADMDIYINKSDILTHGLNDNMSVYITYKINAYNYSAGQVMTQITELHEYFHKDLEFVSSNINGTTIDWLQDGTIGDHIILKSSGFSTNLLGPGSWSTIEIKFKVKTESLVTLLYSRTSFTNTFAEIGKYKSNLRLGMTDLNGNVISPPDAPSGLIDVDSTPGNLFTPRIGLLHNVETPIDYASIGQYVRDVGNGLYSGLSGQERQVFSSFYFEDDAMVSARVNLILAE